jgi:hypothetical protein
MNEMLPSADPSKLRGPKAAKKSRIRAIDKGTTYDVPGRMIRLARAIEHGNFGEVTDVICIVRGKKNGAINSQAHFYGKSATDTLHFMCLRAADRCLQ